MEKQTVQRKRRSVIDTESDSWIECLMTSVWQMLDEECEGDACISTPSGVACHISVRFSGTGSA